MIETEVQTLIPHRGKMLLLSRIINYDIEQGIHCEYDITRECLFYDSAIGGVPAWAGFEFMAQAISVLAGLRSRTRGEKPKIGFILSIPSMRIAVPVFAEGTTADIRLKECDCTDMIYTFEGEIFLGETKAMEGRLMVMEISDERFRSMIKELG